METKAELKQKVVAAYDDYLDKIEALGNESCHRAAVAQAGPG